MLLFSVILCKSQEAEEQHCLIENEKKRRNKKVQSIYGVEKKE